mmetsp:Transcript_108217/g.338650  ORF Transcript_108217/g.338650 Transcript_108217/m.338650 type:complete len:251 (+) Transcript_108217:985-1737(+)
MYQFCLRPTSMSFASAWRGASSKTLLDGVVSGRDSLPALMATLLSSSEPNSSSICESRSSVLAFISRSRTIWQKLSLWKSSMVRRPMIAQAVIPSKRTKALHTWLSFRAPTASAKKRYTGPTNTSRGRRQTHRMGRAKWLATTRMESTSTGRVSEKIPTPPSTSAQLATGSMPRTLPAYHGSMRNCSVAMRSIAITTMTSRTAGSTALLIDGTCSQNATMAAMVPHTIAAQQFKIQIGLAAEYRASTFHM